MTGPKDPGRDDDAALAAEYALGLLEGEARAALAARLVDEPALRALVDQWQADFAPLADEIAPETPPARVKSALEARLFADAAPRRRLSFWRIGGGALAALALAVAVFLVLPQRPGQGPVYRAEIAAEDRSLVLTARFDAAAGTVQVARIAGAAPEGRVLELWLIAADAPAPISLGVLPRAGAATLPVPDALAPGFAGGVLAISEEPPGGSPTGAPTGAVLATGPVTVS